MSNEMDQTNNLIEEFNFDDRLFSEAVLLAVETGSVSTAFLQRNLTIGYNRACEILNKMESLGFVDKASGGPRKVLITKDQYNGIFVKKRSDANCRSSEETATFSFDYSDDGFFIDKLNNFIVPQCDDETQVKFISNLIKYSSPSKLMLALADESGNCFNKFSGAPGLLFPVLTDHSKAVAAINWLNCETGSRNDLFKKLGVYSISEYNKIAEDKSGEIEVLYNIVFIVHEAYFLFNDRECSEALTSLLMNCKRTGIYICLFTCYKQKSLSLGINADLLITATEHDLDHVFSKINIDPSGLSLEEIDNMNGYEFEEFCGALLRKNGFTNIIVTRSSGDYGADIIACKDDIKYAIQCKRYSSPVGIEAVREVLGSKTMYNCHAGVVLTNSSFTPAALELAGKNGILMWDRSRFAKLIGQ